MKVALLALSLLVPVHLPGAPANINEWFAKQMTSKGVPCCNVADGHLTEEDIRAGEYWVPNPIKEGEWLKVPSEAPLTAMKLFSPSIKLPYHFRP